jgi:hypothetical protein
VTHDEDYTPPVMHFCRGEHCPGRKWPPTAMAHPRTCLADPSQWPGAAALAGEAHARVAGDGHVEVLNPSGEVLARSDWTVSADNGERTPSDDDRAEVLQWAMQPNLLDDPNNAEQLFRHCERFAVPVSFFMAPEVMLQLLIEDLQPAGGREIEALQETLRGARPVDDADTARIAEHASAKLETDP